MKSVTAESFPISRLRVLEKQKSLWLHLDDDYAVNQGIVRLRLLSEPTERRFFVEVSCSGFALAKTFLSRDSARVGDGDPGHTAWCDAIIAFSIADRLGTKVYSLATQPAAGAAG